MKILYLCPRRLWESRVSASRRHDVQAVAKHPGAVLHQSGVGWPDWDDNLGGAANVRRIMPDADAVWAYKLDGARVSSVSMPPVRDYTSIGRNYLVVEKLQEAWWQGPNPPPAWKQMIDRRVGLCILSHENDRPRLREAEKRGVTVEVIHHCAEASVFGATNRAWRDRDIAVALTGTIGQEHYPLRTRWRSLADRLSVTIGQQVLHHPRPPHLAPNLKEAAGHVRAYAEVLGRAKLVLGCSSRWRYALARFPEAAAAGAVHVSDMPDDSAFRAGLGKYVIEVSPGASDDKLVEVVLTAWEDQDSIRRRSEAAWRLWRETYTQERFAARFVGAVRRCL